jgi:hypothetical protein
VCVYVRGKTYRVRTKYLRLDVVDHQCELTTNGDAQFMYLTAKREYETVVFLAKIRR